MKRADFERYLRVQGCVLAREGARHSVYLNPRNGEITAVGRHTEIQPFLVRKICKDIGIPPPSSR